ncbi:hypothetical protein THIOM_002236 [Candidatus Thiomargarita nelsonii]|uniref:Uncharacterized protein n=1 Tax=Candidatus Thiomargarita nelsonii TaxID=1003181 RepID=A0A176S1T9_9GAMM|nr:hypothetical protein THIOM_002236 [Candidatus Thiomargarita nelsonii]
MALASCPILPSGGVICWLLLLIIQTSIFPDRAITTVFPRSFMMSKTCLGEAHTPG